MNDKKEINWENLVNIPFAECEVKFDNVNARVDLYHKGTLVLSDYNHVGHYLQDAIYLFTHITQKKAQWVNLENLWILRNCIRENYNHGLGLDSLIYGEVYNGYGTTIRPLTKMRLINLKKTIKKLDAYATV